MDIIEKVFAGFVGETYTGPIILVFVTLVTGFISAGGKKEALHKEILMDKEVIDIYVELQKAQEAVTDPDVRKAIRNERKFLKEIILSTDRKRQKKLKKPNTS